MKNGIKKYFRLQEIYSCPVRLDDVISLFGKRSTTSFLKNNKKYKLKDGWVGTKESLLNIEKVRISEKKIDIAKWLSGYFHLIPWIRFAAVSGSASFGTANISSDIDIFIIVAKNRLWITRGLEEILFNILGVRKVLWKKSSKNKLCINFYTSETDTKLDIKRNHRFLTSLEIVMLKPVFREGFYDYLLYKNKWVSGYFPGIKIKRIKAKNFPRILIISQILDVLDLLAMGIQIGFMKLMGHSTVNSVLKRNRIMFFDQNEKWESRSEII